MAHKTLIDGTAYEISGGKALVDGTAYSIKGGKTLVDGTGYEIGFTKMVGELAVGSSVFLNVDGVPTEFIVVQQGNPDSSKYHSSCDGTWLLMKCIYTEKPGFYSYNFSDVHTYLNDEFISLFDDDIQAQIKTVKIPYYASTNYTGSSGLSTQAFILSAAECGYSGVNSSALMGVSLEYFSGVEKGTNNPILIAYDNNGNLSDWNTRTPATSSSNRPITINGSGGISVYSDITANRGVRPCIIVPPETLV